MITATQTLFAPPSAATDATGGTPRRRSGPVVIQDAVTPWRGETLLLTLWRAEEQRRRQDDD